MTFQDLSDLVTWFFNAAYNVWLKVYQTSPLLFYLVVAACIVYPILNRIMRAIRGR